jgi:hypothetical protein
MGNVNLLSDRSSLFRVLKLWWIYTDDKPKVVENESRKKFLNFMHYFAYHCTNMKTAVFGI